MVVLSVLQKQRDRLLGKGVYSNDEACDVENLKPNNVGLCGLSYCTTLYLWLTLALMVTVICTSGVYLYDEYKHAQNHRFQGWCNIPMEKDRDGPMFSEKLTQKLGFENLAETFHEDFEIFDENVNIDVPDFRDGHRGRFVHDFYSNLTGIVDPANKRCFVMPLDRKTVLPPRSLIDMVKKMMDGYYNVDMNVVKQNMIVIYPPINDYSTVGVHIKAQCDDYPIYRLEKSPQTMFKRSADEVDQFKFTEFAGNVFTELNIMNLQDVEKYEQQLNLQKQ